MLVFVSPGRTPNVSATSAQSYKSDGDQVMTSSLSTTTPSALGQLDAVNAGIKQVGSATNAHRR